jgi:hypothetical protein
MTKERFDPGDLVSVARDYAGLCDSRGKFVRNIPVDSLGVVLTYNPRISSYFVSWDFGRSGWVLRDNLVEVTA